MIFLSALPVLATIFALALGVRSLHAALLGIAAALLAISLAFPVPASSIAALTLRWLPVVTEVLLIVGGGLLLSEVLHQTGGQAALARWLQGRCKPGVATTLLVVHGVTPFAESLTGFGIGVTIGIPLLTHLGLPPRKVAVVGLLGLCAVPWGSMGPGTLIGATLSNLTFHDLGVASALVNSVAFVATGVVAAWLTTANVGRTKAVFHGILSGLALTAAVWAMNSLFGTAAAGALGGLVMVALHLLIGRQRAPGPALERMGRRALASYAVLLGGVLVAGWWVRAAGLSEHWRYMASPALWLFIATVWFARGQQVHGAAQRAWQSWTKVAPVTGLFIVLGVLMAVSGIAAFLAKILAESGAAYLAAAPFVGAVGGFVTGSGSGANAMLAATQAEIARSLGVHVLWFMAVHNVAAAFLLMASPGKVEMAIQLAGGDASDQRRWIQAMVLWVALTVVTVLAVVNVVGVGHILIG
ncbi:L-lactate permease [Lampropedia puyangensis]|uniref:L-lactate permease n=1 Tax=Lampropedia puyangensis TaxID=1330072 RepID=A0A4S8EP04_9BURK|nr:L-lactate permease [Lampropedia puyangensis]THT96407.1 L-lactate permease [Lampropedia puyangensis]